MMQWQCEGACQDLVINYGIHPRCAHAGSHHWHPSPIAAKFIMSPCVLFSIAQCPGSRPVPIFLTLVTHPHHLTLTTCKQTSTHLFA